MIVELKKSDQPPTWDLSDLYPSRDSPELEADLVAVAAAVQDFNGRYAGKLHLAEGEALLQAIKEYEALLEQLGRIESFAMLSFSSDAADPSVAQFYQRMSEKLTDIRGGLLFFTLEIGTLEDAPIADPALGPYRPWLRDLRSLRPHQLTPEIERFFHEKDIVGRAAWLRLFDQTIASLRIEVGGVALSLAQAQGLLNDADRTQRSAAAQAMADAFRQIAPLVGYITSTLAKDKAIEDRWRGYQHPWSARNVANFVEDEIVDALVTSVRRFYTRLSHRYYTLKARWLGLERLAYWDIRAPVPGAAPDVYDWAAAQRTVTAAFAGFSRDLGAIAEAFFARPWIDAVPRPGKYAGAFAAATVPSHHPYILLNFQGRGRDVMELAHELGHGVHHVLASKQGALQASAPVTLAETASVFGEMLTFRRLLDTAKDPAVRRRLLAEKVEAMLATVVRQVAFFEFEKGVHLERRSRDLAADDIADFWMRTQAESLGPAVDLDAGYRFYWTPILHFVRGPFYVYSYAFGECLVNSLYAAYQRCDGAEARAVFASQYLDLLRAGGTKSHRQALAPFGLNAADPQFWGEGLEIISTMIDELEADFG